jgi:hypothetical protein
MNIKSARKELYKKFNLLPLFIDHDDKFIKLEEYCIDKDKGHIYEIKVCDVSSNEYLKRINTGGIYPSCWVRVNKKPKSIMLHRSIILSNVLQSKNSLIKALQKALPHIKDKLHKNPIEILEVILRGMSVHHEDHNKKNHNYSNLSLVTSQTNTKKYIEHKKQSKNKNAKHI